MKLENKEGKLTVILEGRLDAITAPVLPETVEAEVFQELTLDMADLEYISSAGLRGILQCQNIADKRAVSMLLKKPTAAVYDVMRMSGLLKILKIQE